LKDFKGMNDAYGRALALGDVHKREIENNRLALWAQKYNEGVGQYNKGKEDPNFYDKSIQSFDTAILMVPDSSGTYYVKSLALYAKKDYQKTMQALEMAMQKKPDFVEAAVFLGQLYYSDAAAKAEQKDEAGAKARYLQTVGLFEIAYKNDPNNPEAITRLIEAYERAGQSEKAMVLTRDAVAKDPNNKIYRYAYGVFLLKQEKYEESVAQFSKAVEIDPAYTDATYNLGVAYLNWGVSMKVEADKKAEAEKKAKGKEGKEDLTYKEKFKTALPYLEKAAEARGEDAALWQSLGKVYLTLNMKEKGEAAFKKHDSLIKAGK
jgi:tetratricopeptide (TPR) repeat protein